MASELQIRQQLSPAKAVGDVAMVQNAAVRAVGADHFERRAVPDEVIDRLQPARMFFFVLLCQEVHPKAGAEGEGALDRMYLI